MRQDLFRQTIFLGHQFLQLFTNRRRNVPVVNDSNLIIDQRIDTTNDVEDLFASLIERFDVVEVSIREVQKFALIEFKKLLQLLVLLVEELDQLLR